jgi:hypothetical protein
MAGCASTDSASTAELLIAQPPPGWVNVYQLNQKGNRISEFIAGDDDNLDWTRKVTFESFPNISEADPIDLLLYEVEQYQEKCNFVQHFNLFTGMENNYPTSLRLVMCGTHKALEKGEVSMFKAIQGDENFYLVKMTRRVAPFKPHQSEVNNDEIAQWSVFFKRILVCNDEQDTHPCPSVPIADQ